MPESVRSSTPALTIPATFPPAHLAAAVAWPRWIGGLVPWVVYVDTDEDGSEHVTVDPPLGDGVGFHITQYADGVAITWSFHRQTTHAVDLIEAMQLLSPLSVADLSELKAAAVASIAMSINPVA